MIGRKPAASTERAGGLVRAAGLVGMPVVSLGGDRVAEIKDVVFDRGGGAVQGFTLNNPKLFSRSRSDALPIEEVLSIGDTAVIVDVNEATVPVDEVAPAEERDDADVLAGVVLTDAGIELGTVRDVIVDLSVRPPDVVGYEIEPGPGLPSAGGRVLVPVPATLSVSGERLMLPADVAEYVVDDLATFGAAVTKYREKTSDGQLTASEGESS